MKQKKKDCKMQVYVIMADHNNKSWVIDVTLDEDTAGTAVQELTYQNTLDVAVSGLDSTDYWYEEHGLLTAQESYV